MAGTKMKAWQQSVFGLEQLKLSESTIPEPLAGNILARVKAVSLNYRDKLVATGQLLPVPPEMPFTPVSDFAGEVVALGDGVVRFEIGDRIMGNFWTQWIDGSPHPEMMRHGLSLGGPLQGALSEYVVIPEDAAVASPTNLSEQEAATLPIAGLTAWFALAETGRTRIGDTVLVQGTGGVALFAAQIAAAMGAKPIITSRSDGKLKRAGRLAPWATINTTTMQDWSRTALDLTGGKGVDHILETVGGANVSQSLQSLAPEGRLSLIGFLGGFDISISAVPLMLRRATIQGVSVGHRRAFERLVRFVEEHDLHPVIDHEYEFADALSAFTHLEQGPFGKVTVKVT